MGGPGASAWLAVGLGGTPGSQVSSGAASAAAAAAEQRVSQPWDARLLVLVLWLWLWLPGCCERCLALPS